VRYYSKAQIGEFKVEAHGDKKGDNIIIIIIITGPTTGVVEHEMTELMVDDKMVEEAKKGDHVTFKIRSSNNIK